ncbi:capsule assembly Wzi family protein [Dyadobacter sp. CY326]|uniref:capsule assembly Wzi family protein n=1 Tax=Dyadobacter sp. CY326 TaxID=2907300 RepID=UPI001F2E9DFD|nr:capsule assembly Wzi family protein [Dyadobacter sp. CY326]MCE7065637.1 capsule assembly Wzi family protein [Dyadobacter sp. CY326]
MSVRAQENKTLIPNIHASLEAGAYISSPKTTPFWLRTNQFGIVPNTTPAGQIQGTVSKPYVFFDSLTNRKKKTDWGFAVNPVLTYTDKDQLKVQLPESHVKARFRMLEIYAGRRKEVMGLGDTTLSSGFYSGSGNSMPIPKVQIGTVTFVPLKFTANFLAIHAGFAHGWFNTNYIKGIRLHQKFLYFRLGKPQSKSKFYFGLNHNVLWAGHSEELKNHPELALNGELPSSWKFFPNVVLAYTSKNWFEKNGYGSFDSYRLGNHLGSYDFAFETKFDDKKLFIYHQHPFEDVSSMLFKNIPDGLYGINLKMNRLGSDAGFVLTHVTLEFLTTKDQSGSTFYIPGSTYQGADNYFNHSQYSKGWSYNDRTVGTPFIVPGVDMDKSNVFSGRYFPSNRVNVFYGGAQGKWRNVLSLTLRASYSRNFGIPGEPFNPPRGQLSTLLGAQYDLPSIKRTSLIARLAIDNGDIFVHSTGGYIGIRRSW